MVVLAKEGLCQASVNLQELKKIFLNPGFLIRQHETEKIMGILTQIGNSDVVEVDQLKAVLLQPGVLSVKQLTDLLHTACRMVPANPDFIEALVHAGAVIDLPRLYSSLSRTPLYLCVENSQPDAVERLLELGAPIVNDRSELSCLDLALREGCLRNVEVLLRYASRAEIEAANPFMAVGHSDLRMVQLLHEAGVDFAVRTATGLSPLHFAVTLCAKYETGVFVIVNDSYRKKLDIVRYLYENCGQEISAEILLSAMERKGFLTLAFVYLLHLRRQQQLTWPEDLPSKLPCLPLGNTDILKQIICRAGGSCKNPDKILDFIFETNYGKTGRAKPTLFELSVNVVRDSLAKSGLPLEVAAAATTLPLSVQRKVCLRDLEHWLEVEMASCVYLNQSHHQLDVGW